MFAAAVKLDTPLPWEDKKQVGMDRKIVGPQSLRKVPVKVLTVRNNLLTDAGNALIMRNTMGSATEAQDTAAVTTRTSMISVKDFSSAPSSSNSKSSLIKRKNSSESSSDMSDSRISVAGKGGTASSGTSPSSASSQTDSIPTKSGKRSAQSKGGTAPVLSPSSASAKSTMFNKVTSVFQFRSKNERASFS